ncbi:Acyl-CoA dehydrogenase [Pseudooceanicola batsensis HTCC2597]|uniref:Acyl-coenzyme A dehydrogenase n=1 Tax=Pseudooceanicola batsensis (strain ATCC BAA-863 / DSM 15984 / KCTC 12145 / HTCC2597) TaxID=252305 RepID=A3TT53_PSEBH|nr:acyl-CoA dehydrogenase [Pseudooceanicola batsensis]EAQ04830.1 Acyl-CoA dehydrogenase [Pseudooceanicola batsensis HTCC2597]
MSFRKSHITRPIFDWAKGALPTLSETEAEAISAGDVHFEAELFSGKPDWSKLRAMKAPALTEEERAFIDGPCREFCDMVDTWVIDHRTGDLSSEAWDHMRDKGFFGMIIPKEHGGLGFSAYAHSEVVRYIASHSVVAAVTVMVPNSLGPGELILQFGTDEQKSQWLPRLARGDELPAFGLTSEDAGSDASAMTDEGVICKGDWNGREVLGIRLNWAKRYITLAPVCTVLGLAFKLRDPDGLIGETEDIGITCALVPTDLPGVETGRRHLPSGTMFQNGPTTGKDVFIPLDHIIGGPDYAGRGWMMLMSALAAGRGISLPSLSAAATAMAAHTTGAYSRIRKQFNLPIGLFGGVQEPMARIAASAYTIDAGRRLTTAALDEGHKLAVISAIMKYHATDRMRDAINDAMDVHSGKAVIDGPLNYLQPIYRTIPIGITVEGANIVTRNLIIFGQGAIRAHPHILDEMQALQEPDREKSLDAFDTHFWAHVKHSVRTVFRAGWAAWTGRADAPADAGAVAPIYRRLSRWSAAFAVTADMAFLTLGGALKRKEMISARLGDALSEMYLIAATLKRWEDEGRNEEDLPLVRHAAETGFARIGQVLDETIANMPARWVNWLLRPVLRPGAHPRGPSDKTTEEAARIIYEPNPARDRLVTGFHPPHPDSGLGLLETAYRLVLEAEPIAKRLREARKTPRAALEAGLLSDAEFDQLRRVDEAVQKVVAVDDYSPDELQQLFPDMRRFTGWQEAAE